EVGADDGEVEERALHALILLERQAVERFGGDEPVLAMRDEAEVVEGELVLRILRERVVVRRGRFVDLPGVLRLQSAIERVGGAPARGSTARGGDERGRECEQEKEGFHRPQARAGREIRTSDLWGN